MKVPQSQSETCECDIHVGQTVTCRMMQFYKKKKKNTKKTASCFFEIHCCSAWSDLAVRFKYSPGFNQQSLVDYP